MKKEQYVVLASIWVFMFPLRFTTLGKKQDILCRPFCGEWRGIFFEGRTLEGDDENALQEVEVL